MSVLSPQQHWAKPVAASAAATLITIAVFWPARHYDFVNIDDARHVFKNPLVMGGISFESLLAAMRNTGPDYWRPVSTISLMIDAEVYGVDPEHPQAFGFHLTNILLHGVGTGLLMMALHSLTGSLWRSLAVAMLFAVHPLRVESVAWVTERKDVLSGVFAFACLWTYSHYTRKPSAWRMTATAGWLGLGLMSKSILVTWPAVLVLLDVWPLRRVSFAGGLRATFHRFVPLLREKTLLFIMAVLSCIITIRTGSRSIAEIPFEHRLAHVAVSYVRYLGKMFWPDQLAAYYPYPGLGGAEPYASWHIIGAAVVLLVMTVIAVAYVRSRPFVFVGWFWFIGMLVPVIGLVQVGDQGLADRFTYLPGIGVTLMAVWLSGELVKRVPMVRWPVSAIIVCAIAALSMATRAHLPVWSNTDALYHQALAVTHNNRSVRSFYGDYLYFQGRHDEAIAQFSESIRFSPDDPEPHYKLGIIYSELGRHFESQRAFERSLDLFPDDADAHYNLARVLWMRGQLSAARQHLEKAIALNPRGAANYGELRQILDARPAPTPTR